MTKPGQKKGPNKRIRSGKRKEAQLTTDWCTHPRGKIESVKNRKGRYFKECQLCGAFLGWED